MPEPAIPQLKEASSDPKYGGGLYVVMIKEVESKREEEGGRREREGEIREWVGREQDMFVASFVRQ